MKQTTTTITKTHMQIGFQDLLKMLPLALKIPTSARIYVHVPAEGIGRRPI